MILLSLLLLVLAQDVEPIVLTDDGGWCWFQDERALIHGDTLIVGSVASGYRDPDRRGDVQVSTFDFETGEVSTFELHDRLELDDHAAPAFVRLPDGRYRAVYTRHGSDDFVRTRVTLDRGDTSRWGPENTFRVESAERGVTYSNLFFLPGEAGGGTLVDLHRGADWDPSWLVSDDLGVTWRHGGRLLGGPGRPYLRYAFDGREEIHFIATEQHPRDFDNGIYHGFLRAGGVFRSDGARAEGAQGVVRPEDLTRVFPGVAERVAWTVDLELDSQGHPYAAFSVQVDGAGLPTGQGGMDHRYYYARWTGAAWSVHEMAFAGTRLYAGEDDYTGLAALHPDDPDLVFVSTDAHPATGAPLVSEADGERHHEIFRGVTADGGASWTWEAVTCNSTADNLRPIVPPSDGARRMLLWLRGVLQSYTDYELSVVGRVLPR